MAEVRKVLGQLKVAAINTYESVYAVPSGSEAIVSSLFICNKGAGTGTFRVVVITGGVPIPPQDKNHIYYDIPITKKDTFVATAGITLNETDYLAFYTSSADIVISVFGVEITK